MFVTGRLANANGTTCSLYHIVLETDYDFSKQQLFMLQKVTGDHELIEFITFL